MHNAPQVLKVDAFTEYCAKPTFTPIFILFEPNVAASAVGNNQVGNEYEIKICSQFHCHFKQGSTLANMAKEPRVNMALHNRAHHQEESLGSYMKRAFANEVYSRTHGWFGTPAA